MTEKEQAGDDALTEYMIDVSYLRMMAASDTAVRRLWCDRMTYWIRQRSPERIRDMERMQGLDHGLT